MDETGVLAYILHPGSWEVLKTLVALEHALGLSPSALLRLAAFHPVLDEVKHHLRLSKKQESTLAFLGRNHPLVLTETFKQQAYYSGIERTFELA